MSAENEAVAASGGGRTIPKIWRGLLWREWLAHEGLVLWTVCAWIVGGWVLMLFFHPGWIIGFGVLYAMIAGQSFGGGDTLAGTEEFTISLPPTRRHQYVARLILACGTTLAFTAFGTLAIAFDLPQRVWGLVVESGFTEPFPPCDPPWLYGLAIGAPFLTLALTFGIAATAKTRGTAIAAAFVGLVGVFAEVWIAYGAEHLLWGRETGLITVTAPLAIGVMVLLYGYGRYLRKEAVARPGGTGRMSGVVIVVIVIVVVALLMLTMRVNVGTESSMDAHRAEWQKAVSDNATRPEEPALAPASKTKTTKKDIGPETQPAPSSITAPARAENGDR
ncbi:MAG: hypothetical protein ABIF82_00520 [Planctomycetota bacterium]